VFRTHDSETRDRMRDICFPSYITLLFANIEQISHYTPVRNPLVVSTQRVSVLLLVVITHRVGNTITVSLGNERKADNKGMWKRIVAFLTRVRATYYPTRVPDSMPT